VRLARGALGLLMPLALLVTPVAGAGCAAAPPPIKLTEAWPAQPGDFEAVNEAWTRKAILRGEYQQALEVYAVFHSPEWRAARAQRDIRVRNLTNSAREATLAAAKAAAEGDYELTLVVTTYARCENDLHRGDRSVWRMVLVDDHGTETPPSKIVRDRRPPYILRAELPMLGDFATVYVVTFPRTAGVLREGAKRATLRMWSARGAVELVWSGQ
jgi:hypothetical protein